jgi:hypothetical protein
MHFFADSTLFNLPSQPQGFSPRIVRDAEIVRTHHIPQPEGVRLLKMR